MMQPRLCSPGKIEVDVEDLGVDYLTVVGHKVNDAAQAIGKIEVDVEDLGVDYLTVVGHKVNDAAQAIGKIEVDVEDLGVDYLTVVGHKFYGPRIGAIYVRNLGDKDVPLYPMLYGGGQERNYRPGTENTVMISGLGKAAELVVKNIICYKNHLSSIRDYLEIKLQEAFKDRIHLNGKFTTSERLPNTCNVSILSDKLQVLSNCRILQASIGAACHSQNRPSPILLAIGVPESVARNALRLSVGRETTKDDIDCVIQDLIQAVNQLENHTTET
ncbi:SCLY [Mytilus edulis]|uniref:Selenocysteine lyase n=1 Tax=Mytilus edulis TaxID=6550 RepID=A0A8S3RYE5_MYTED|nr:SCLY [Mytilus edulis]